MKNSLLNDIKVQISYGRNQKEDLSLSDFGKFANNRNNKFKERVCKALAKEKIEDIKSSAAKAVMKKERVRIVHNTKNIKGQSAAIRELNNTSINADYSKDMEAKTLSARYRIIALTFFRLVARTPIDEDYYYHFYEPREIKQNGRTVKTYIKEVIRKHTADESVARDDWECLLTLESGKELKITTQTLESLGLDLENEHDNASIRALTHYLVKQSNGETYTHFQFINLNEHFEYLEFGLYNSNGVSASENSDYAHKGEKRFHGNIHGYSVQAPRGIARLTAQEFSSAVENVIQRTEETGRQQKLLARKIKLDKDWGLNEEEKKIIAENFTKNFTEKDIYKAYLEGRDTLDITTDEEKRKFNFEQSKKFKEIAKEFENKAEKEVKKQEHVPGRKRGKDKKTRIRTKFTKGEIINRKYRAALEVLNSYVDEEKFANAGNSFEFEYIENGKTVRKFAPYKIENGKIYIGGYSPNPEVSQTFWETPQKFIENFGGDATKENAVHLVESIINEINKKG